MMKRAAHITIVIVLLICGIDKAVAQKRNTLTITEERLILQIDLQSSEKTIDSILKVAGISDYSAEKVMKGNFSVFRNDGWDLADRENNLVRFEKSLGDLDTNPQSTPYLITTRTKQTSGRPGYPENVKYGINKFSKLTVYQLPSGLTHFVLPGYQEDRRVFLAGSFNGWSTLKGLMKKADGGWVYDIMLKPGACEYKYIIDGNWRTDPNNLQEMNDGNGNINSVYYKYNFTFKLPGYASARKVTVAGSFNKWNPNELVMEKSGNSWERQLYLADGKSTYRFMVDGKWIADPENPDKEKDGNGTVNSSLNLGETVIFKLPGYRDAKKVVVSGSFNNWNQNEYVLQRKGDLWAIPLVLTAGNYNYRFIVDGKWITDPSNASYSVEDSKTNSFLAVRPNHTFKLKGFGKAKSVKLAGSFTDWEKNAYTVARVGDEWVISFYLKPGKYLYKFIVDGKWILDPGNKLWEQNAPGTGNSVLWIE